MTNLKLDQEERALLAAFEADEFESILTDERQGGEATFKKDKRINIRISVRDLAALQRRALQEGLPYQTLVASVLDKYAAGSLRDVMAENIRS
jgi:predicted DNA binding CopG/RHH family protein